MKKLQKCVALALILLVIIPVIVLFANGENGSGSVANATSENGSGSAENATSENASVSETVTPSEDENTGVVYEKLDMTVMTFNIRYQTSDDTGVKSWDSRKSAVSDFILAQDAGIVCMQEVKSAQKDYLNEALSSEYSMIWYGRDTGTSGEGLAIAYKKNEWKLIEQDCFWISETPDTPSYGWGATIRRICVNAVLEHKTTKARIAVYNIHLDHKKEEARVNGIQLVLDRIALSEYPVYLCGDFNAKKSSEAYAHAAAAMNDSQDTSAVTELGSTYNSWGTISADAQNVIDYNFFTKDDFETLSYDICTDKWGENNENCISDHYAVKSTVKMLYIPYEELPEEIPPEDTVPEVLPEVSGVEGSDGEDGSYSKNY